VKCTYYAHQGADHLLASCGLLEELDIVFRRLPLPVWHAKSGANPSLDVVQQVLNSFIEYELVSRDWLSQAQVLESAHDFYADFWKQSPRQWDMPGLPPSSIKALCEIQFGNVARLGMDNEKFRIGYLEGRADVGIEVVPTRVLANRIDTAVASYEKTVSLLQRLGRTGMPTPILVIGLEPDDSTFTLNLRDHFSSLQPLRGSHSQAFRQQFAASFYTTRGALLGKQQV
jgi:hypothetical protein